MLNWIDHHGLFVLVLLVFLKNLVTSLPKPGTSTAAYGFGSSSVGYSYLYRVAQGCSLDARSLGFDPKTLTQRFVAKEDTKEDVKEDTKEGKNE